jgi:hypothetical protein
MPCVYLPGPAPAVTVANNYPFKSYEEKNFIPNIQIFLAAVAKYAEWNLTFADNTWNEI